VTTRMRHDEHGWTHAYEVIEVERLKALGWKVEPDAPPIVQPPKDGGMTPKRKPGRPKGS
jgi:hypothetical protein